MQNQNKQTILSFIDWYRPGYKAGGTITAFGNFVDYLEDDLDFRIVTRNTDYFETTPYENIKPNIWTDLSKTKVYYLSNVNYQSIKKLVFTTHFDWLYVNGVFSFYFSILPVMLSGKRNCMVNPHGMLSDQAFSVKSFKKKLFLKFANTFSLYRNTVFHVANGAEAADVKKRVHVYKSIEIRNQLPRKMTFDENKFKNNTLTGPTKFVTVSRISKEKGILKMLEALSSVKESVILDMYGPVYDETYWQTCKCKIESLPSHINVNYKGSIDGNQILKQLQNYEFFVLLSEGENFGHAILEAFSAGCPVIISDKTPWKNLSDEGIGWEVNIHDQDKIVKIFQEATHIDEIDYQRMSINAMNFAKRFSENPELLNTNLDLFKNS